MKLLYFFSILLVFAACKKKDSPPIINSTGTGSSANSKFVGNYEGILSTDWGSNEAVLTVEKGTTASKIRMFFDLDPSTIYQANVNGYSFLLEPKNQQNGTYVLTTIGEGELAEDGSYIYLELEQIYSEGGVQMTSPTTMWFYGIK